MANRRIGREECLVLLQAGWCMIQERGQATVRRGRQVVMVAGSTVLSMQRDGTIEKAPALEGDPPGRVRFRLRMSGKPDDIKLA
jgi:hypothetical protein